MKLLVLLSFAATTWACAYSYHYCHCMNPDGSPNDDATKTICTSVPPGWWLGLGGWIQNMNGGGVECVAPDSEDLFDNCAVNEMCQACNGDLAQNCRNKNGYD
ncbi:hypothetical protein V8E54_007070 [Elaphomyces granulatus]|jgi:hypothetical protein